MSAPPPGPPTAAPALGWLALSVACTRDPASAPRPTEDVGANMVTWCTAQARVVDGTYDGTLCALPSDPVVLVGEVAAIVNICTAQACGPEDPCCNACGATPALRGVDGGLLAVAAEWNCGGNDCALTCAAYPAGARLRVRGVVRTSLAVPELVPETVEVLSLPAAPLNPQQVRQSRLRPELEPVLVPRP